MRIEDKIKDIFDIEEAEAMTTPEGKIIIDSSKSYVEMEKILFSNEYLLKNVKKLSSTRFTFIYQWYNSQWTLYYIEVKDEGEKCPIKITPLVTPVATDGGVLYV